MPSSAICVRCGNWEKTMLNLGYGWICEDCLDAVRERLINSQDLLQEIVSILHNFNEDELLVTYLNVKGLEKGRENYGPLDLEQDQRDFNIEILEEQRDTSNYAQMKLIQILRKNGQLENFLHSLKSK